MTNDLPKAFFDNPVWSALETAHRHFAVRCGDASRYPADVTPFAAVAAPTEPALRDLHSLLVGEESVWIVGETYPQIEQLRFEQTLKCCQMILPQEVDVPALAPDPHVAIESLSKTNADEMVALTNVAFPGYFRQRTCAMGAYFGIRSNGELIAMSGERFKLDGYSEISAVCTHPAHRGKGLAAHLMWSVIREQRREGVVSWLHVASANQRAIDLYLRMGFRQLREVTLHRISRNVCRSDSRSF